VNVMLLVFNSLHLALLCSLLLTPAGKERGLSDTVALHPYFCLNLAVDPTEIESKNGGSNTTVLHTNCIESASANIMREWFAFRVRPRHEKSVALQLRDKREECFVPLVRQTRNWANRLAHVDLPLIPGYVFCRSHRFGFLPILKTPGVVDVIRAGSSPVPIPDEEISALERVLNASVRLESCPYLEMGQRVEIRNGPLAGITGIVIDNRKATQLVLSVSILRRSVLVHVDLASVSDDGTGLIISERHRVA
jgi:transcription antitermination factor NusG